VIQEKSDEYSAAVLEALGLGHKFGKPATPSKFVSRIRSIPKTPIQEVPDPLIDTRQDFLNEELR
jgi:hypothetical protein